ncbi:MAG: ribosome maturation factor RimP [Campylobacterales bacterium]
MERVPLEQMIKRIVEENGCQLYDIELVNEGGNQIYRVYITKPGGVTLNDCTKINNLLSPILDIEEPVEGRYYLEVSSPGLERKLTKESHFQMSIGEQVKVVTQNGEKFKGELRRVEDGEIQVGRDRIKLADIKKAKTYIDWNNYKGLK